MTTLEEPAATAGEDEPMTPAQRHYLESLAREVGERLPAGLTRLEADHLIEVLQKRTGRGLGG